MISEEVVERVCIATWPVAEEHRERAWRGQDEAVREFHMDEMRAALEAIWPKPLFTPKEAELLLWMATPEWDDKPDPPTTFFAQDVWPGAKAKLKAILNG